MPTLASGQVVDVGKIVRELTEAYPLAQPPRVSPSSLGPLIKYLRLVTDEVAKQYDRLRVWGIEQGNLGNDAILELQRIQTELVRWQLRLANYEANQIVCEGTANDPACTIWTIVAPLFFGFFDGATGTSPQKPADIATPFALANQLGALRQWSVDQLGWTAYTRDLVEQAKVVGGVINEGVQGTMRALGAAAGAALGGAGGGLLAGGGGGLTMIVVAGVVLWFVLRKRKPVIA